MNTIKDIHRYMEIKDFPFSIRPNEIVMGFDEVENKFLKVQYRWGSNRFFDYPYNGSVYPLERMNKFKKIISENTKDN